MSGSGRPSLEATSPFWRNSTVSFPKKKSSTAAADTNTDTGTQHDGQSHQGGDETSEPSIVVSSGTQPVNVPQSSGARPSVSSTSSSGQFRSRSKSDSVAFSILASFTGSNSSSGQFLTPLDSIAPAPSSSASSGRFAANSRAKSLPGNLEPEPLAKGGVYPSQVENDDLWFDEPWLLVQLHDDSHLLNMEKVRLIAQNLPPHYQGNDWRLIYSTYRDGISLQTLLRKSCEVDGPCVLVIKEPNGHLLGGFTMHAWKHVSAYSHSGTGESFVFCFDDSDGSIHAYHWTGKLRACVCAKRFPCGAVCEL